MEECLLNEEVFFKCEMRMEWSMDIVCIMHLHTLSECDNTLFIASRADLLNSS